MQYLRIILFVFLPLLTLHVPPCFADGDLDPSFGDEGLVMENFQVNSSDYLTDLLVLANDKILVIGNTVIPPSGPEQHVLAKYNSDGNLDSSFGTDGFTIGDFGSIGGRLITDNNARIIFGVSAYNDFSVVRYTADGELDTSFGDAGLARVDFEATYGGVGEGAASVALQLDGKIIVVGTISFPDDSTDGYYRKIGVVRLHADGTLDTSFGNSGYSVLDIGVSLMASDVAVMQNGKILISIQNDFPSNNMAGLMCLNGSGSLDPSFAGTGYVLLDIGSRAGFPKIVFYPGQRIVLAWGGFPGSASETNFALVMFNFDGSLVSDFGNNGVAISNFGSVDYASDAVVRDDGKLIVSGEVDGKFAVARYNQDGSLDFSFGDAGLTVTDIGQFWDAAISMGLQNDQRIIVGGVTVISPTAGYSLVLAGYTNCLTSINLTPPTLSNGTVGSDYIETITASGGTTPYTFSVSNGTLPPGLSLDHMTGVISGIPTTVGVYNFDIIASDVNGCSGIINYGVSILGPCLFCDEFEDGVLDPDWTYKKNDSLWSESGGNLLGFNSRTTSAIASPVFPGCINCYVEATMKTAGGIGNRAWLFHHFVDKNNMIEVQMKEEQNRWIVKQRINKTVVVKAKVLQTIDPNVAYTVRITFDGTNYLISINGVQVLTFTPVGAISGGTVGFKVKGTQGTFSYIHVNN